MKGKTFSCIDGFHVMSEKARIILSNTKDGKAIADAIRKQRTEGVNVVIGLSESTKRKLNELWRN